MITTQQQSQLRQQSGRLITTCLLSQAETCRVSASQVAKLQATASAQQLSTDVWAKIFEHFKPKQSNTVHSYEDTHQQVGAPWVQTERMLRSVCKRFDDVFKQHPQLCSSLWLYRLVHVQALQGYWHTLGCTVQQYHMLMLLATHP